MCVTDRHDITLAVKVALNPNTTNQKFSLSTVCCFDSGYVGKQPVAWKEYFAEYWLKELQESKSWCDITEILLKMALNTTQSVNP